MIPPPHPYALPVFASYTRPMHLPWNRRRRRVVPAVIGRLGFLGPDFFASLALSTFPSARAQRRDLRSSRNSVLRRRASPRPKTSGASRRWSSSADPGVSRGAGATRSSRCDFRRDLLSLLSASRARDACSSGSLPADVSRNAHSSRLSPAIACWKSRQLSWIMHSKATASLAPARLRRQVH